jgi:hypothetical protein
VNRDVEKVMKQPDAWVLVKEYGTLMIYWDKGAALDRMTRRDKLFHVRIAGWSEESAFKD